MYGSTRMPGLVREQHFGGQYHIFVTYRKQRGGYEVYRPYKHAVVHMLKENKFCKHFGGDDWEIF